MMPDNIISFLIVCRWRKSSCAYLNEPAATSIDGNGASKDTTYTPQKIHWYSQALYNINVTVLGIF
jgi:hypothetical protein